MKKILHFIVLIVTFFVSPQFLFSQGDRLQQKVVEQNIILNKNSIVPNHNNIPEKKNNNALIQKSDVNGKQSESSSNPYFLLGDDKSKQAKYNQQKRLEITKDSEIKSPEQTSIKLDLQVNAIKENTNTIEPQNKIETPIQQMQKVEPISKTKNQLSSTATNQNESIDPAKRSYIENEIKTLDSEIQSSTNKEDESILLKIKRLKKLQELIGQ